MEGCLKKLVLEAQATGFQGPKKGAGSRWDRLRENSCSEGSTGGKGVYIRYRREAKKFIPVQMNYWSVSKDGKTLTITSTGLAADNQVYHRLLVYDKQ